MTREGQKKLATTVYITEEQQALLKELNRRTRVPIAEFIREGIDLVLAKHQSDLPGQLELSVIEDTHARGDGARLATDGRISVNGRP